jgi:hypothetical protein
MKGKGYSGIGSRHFDLKEKDNLGLVYMDLSTYSYEIN